MGSHPLAPLSAAERTDYRTAILAHVLETVYRYWQRGIAVALDDIVIGVRAIREDTPLLEIHRAVAALERTSVIQQTTSRPAGLWRRVDTTQPPDPTLPSSPDTCSAPGCLRTAGHPFSHLPDLHGMQLTAQLAIRHDDFMAVWHHGSPWITVYRDATSWQDDGDPAASLVVPHECRFVPDTIVAVVTAWLSSDDYPTPPETDIGSRHQYAFSPGVDHGTLVYRHADYVGVWDHDACRVEFYDDVTAWDDGQTPIATVDVPAGEPFTGAVLAQITEEWAERHFDTRPTEAGQSQEFGQ